MHNMTTGSPLKRIINFSIPLLIGNIFQLVYNMVDTFIVGRTMGRDALAGISASSGLRPRADGRINDSFGPGFWC